MTSGRRGWRASSRWPANGWGEVFWSATWPSFGGILGLAQDPSLLSEDTPNRQRSAEGTAVVSSAGLSIDGRALDDARWRGDLIDGFVGAADGMRCVYAHAEASRNWGYGGGRLWGDRQTETWFRQAIDRYGNWRGLPHNPVWLAWLGEPYAHFQAGTPRGRGRLIEAKPPAEHGDAPPRRRLPVPDQWLVAGEGSSVERAARVPEGL